MLDAVGDVVAEDFFLHAAQGSAHRGDLGDDVYTIAIALDHSGKAAHLTLDPTEALEDGFLWLVAHIPNIYTGMGYSPSIAR